MEGRLSSTHRQWHIFCERFTKFAVYRHLLATMSQHCQHCQANA